MITDHVRALTFLLADGFTPSNEGAGYVLRRILRIAYRFGRQLGIGQPFLYGLVPAVVDAMGPDYPEIVEAQSRVTAWIEQEEKQFEETLERSYSPLVTEIQRAKAAGLTVLPGEVVFRLYDTYGLPKEIAADVAEEHGLTLDEEGFTKAMAEQRERARTHAEKDFAFEQKSGYQNFVAKTEFTGYHNHVDTGTIIGLVERRAAGGATWPRVRKARSSPTSRRSMRRPAGRWAIRGRLSREGLEAGGAGYPPPGGRRALRIGCGCWRARRKSG